MGNLFAKCLSAGGQASPRGQVAAPASAGSHRRALHDDIVNSIAATGGGGWESVSGGEEGFIKVFSWDSKHADVVAQWQQPCAVNRLAAACVGAKELIYSGGRDGTVRVWRKGTSSAIQSLTGHELAVNAVAACASQPSRAFSGSRDWSVKVWDADAASEVASTTISRNVVTFAKWIGSEGDLVVQASEDLTLRVWDIRSMGKPAETFVKCHNNVMTCCDASGDGNTLLTSSNGFDGAGCELRVWDRRKAGIVSDLVGHQQSVTCCAFVPFPSNSAASPSIVVSGSQDATIRTWDAVSSRCIDSVSVDIRHRLTSLAVCPIGDEQPGAARVATASFSGGLGLWAVTREGSISLVDEASDEPLQHQGGAQTQTPE